MTRYVRRMLAAAWVVMTAASVGAGSLSGQQDRLVVLVRHAERAAEPVGDPGLTEAGAARAVALQEALAGARIGAVVTTQLRRTQLTAAPLAEALGLIPVVVATGGGVEAHARAVADAVRASPEGAAVLVVGHSNTVPAIVAALGGPRLPDLCERQYARLFTMVISPSRPSRLIVSSFGAADPPEAGACHEGGR